MNNMRSIFGIFIMVLSLLTACQQKPGEIVVGAARFDILDKKLAGKNIGLIVNQASVVGSDHLIDVFGKRGYNIQTLFALEHGIGGQADAGEKISDGVDRKTGIKIVSLYGKRKIPIRRDLAGVDILVFDLQDVGVRFYTYLSSLHHIMQACADYSVPLLVLDRPNPNIEFVDGPVLKPRFRSFVGMHEIPLLHGMTLGELALMINGEAWLDGNKKCDLQIIRIKNYTRQKKYILPVRPSPNLPNQQAIRLYPSLALFEATNISVGRGTDFAFQVLGGNNPGFGDFSFTPRPKPGAKHPKHESIKLYGRDLRKASISGLDIDLFLAWSKRAGELGEEFITRPDWLDKLTGSDDFRQQVEAGLSAGEIRKSWQKDLQKFKQRRKAYLLYPDQ